MKKSLLLSALLVALLGANSARAQALYTGAYAETFDEMGTGTAAPAGYSVYSEAGSHATFAPPGSFTAGVSPNFTAGALTLESTLTVGVPTTQKGIVGYNFDASGLTGVAGDRALGTSPSGNAATIIELSLTNTSGLAVNALNISYDIDAFTTTKDNNGDSTSSPNYGVEEYPGYQLFYSLNGGTTWTNVSALNPTIDAGTTGAVNVPNAVQVNQVGTLLNPNTVALSSTWAVGANLKLAWFDDNAESPSPDQLIGLNNVTITTAVTPEPSSLALCLAGVAFLFFMQMRRRSQI